MVQRTIVAISRHGPYCALQNSWCGSLHLDAFLPGSSHGSTPSLGLVGPLALIRCSYHFDDPAPCLSRQRLMTLISP